MSIYNHDVAMSGHAKRGGTVTVTECATGLTFTGRLLIWRPNRKYRARVQHTPAFTRTYSLKTHDVEIIT